MRIGLTLLKRYWWVGLIWALVYATFFVGGWPSLAWLQGWPERWKATTLTERGQIGDALNALTGLFAVITALESVAVNREQNERLERQERTAARVLLNQDLPEISKLTKEIEAVRDASGQFFEYLRLASEADLVLRGAPININTPLVPFVGDPVLMRACNDVVREMASELEDFRSSHKLLSESAHSGGTNLRSAQLGMVVRAKATNELAIELNKRLASVREEAITSLVLPEASTQPREGFWQRLWSRLRGSSK